MIGIIGGTGLYSLSPDLIDKSSPMLDVDLFEGKVAGKDVLFVPRHGVNHRFSPTEVPYEAEMRVLKAEGATKIIAVCAVGSLKQHPAPGSLVVPRQIIDLTTLRVRTSLPGGHLSFANPYCETLRNILLNDHGIVYGQGTVVVIEGPRFSTEAESRFFAYGMNADLINMTQMPEALMAREMGLCYAAIAVVTDYDAGVQVGREAVTYEEVISNFHASLDKVKSIIFDVIEKEDLTYECESCSTAASAATA